MIQLSFKPTSAKVSVLTHFIFGLNEDVSEDTYE